jgi:hypothetical protein
MCVCVSSNFHCIFIYLLLHNRLFHFSQVFHGRVLLVFMQIVEMMVNEWMNEWMNENANRVERIIDLIKQNTDYQSK